MKHTYLAPELTMVYALDEDILTVSKTASGMGVEIDCSDWGTTLY